MARILVTGGSGYIGSHTIVSLLEAGHTVVAVDNLSRSSVDALRAAGQIVGVDIPFVEGDVRETATLDRAFSEFGPIAVVVHFAAYKSVRESTEFALRYHSNNVGGLVSLLEAMERHDVQRLVFSSSCTVYGQPDVLPIDESAPIVAAASPYGSSKQVCEQIIADVATHPATSGLQSAISLRYFNPAGAHESGLLGESPVDRPDNLVPFITQTAAEWRDRLEIFGSDYDTIDGTAVRDYLHVMDLAEAHVAAVERVLTRSGLEVFNLGTGEGSSVLQVVRAFERVSGQKLPIAFADRRAGDVEKVWASCALANQVLGWRATRSLEDILASAWVWQQKLARPRGLDASG